MHFMHQGIGQFAKMQRTNIAMKFLSSFTQWTAYK